MVLQQRPARRLRHRLGPHPEGRLARSMAKRGMAHDWRDFDQIRAWAHTIATDISKQ
ncbi:hypothetical protein [Streptomyces sp. NRRL F-5755]|uniref:hypothetical protein n=1 Tax=Streptomyces sp. NRRL F-5755 TaxID=1519475 RepID=UPI000AA06071|nr:hypothetical protein [Streptomyces sp. NRRL F-5755]